MKFSRIALSLVLITSPTLLACSDDAKEQASAVANEAEESWDALKLYTIERSADFRASVNSGLRELDGQLAKASDRGGEAWAATRTELDTKRAELAVQLDALGAATADTWATMRDKTVALYQEFHASVKRAIEQPEE